MSDMKDIRWKQRYENLQKSLARLHTGLAITHPDDTSKAGIVQLFEVSFELAWKTLRDYLESIGYEVVGPRPVIKQAFEVGMLADGEAWLRMLEDRNLSIHLYDEKTINDILARIRSAHEPLLAALVVTLNDKAQQQ